MRAKKTAKNKYFYMKLTFLEMQQIETEMLGEVQEICQRHDIDYYVAYGTVLGTIRHGGSIPWDSDIDIIVPHNQIDKFVETHKKELSEKFYVDYYKADFISQQLYPRIGLKGYSTSFLHIDVYKMTGISPEPEEQKAFIKKAQYYKKLFFYKNFNPAYGGKYSKPRIWLQDFIKLFLLPFSNEYILGKFDALCNKYPIEQSEYVTNINGGYGMKEPIPMEFYGAGTMKPYADIEVKVPEKYDDYLRHFYGDYMQLPPENERKIPPYRDIVEV